MLAVLGREWMLHGHLQDRVGVPLAIGLGGSSALEEVSIEEWMAASPAYTRRIRRAMGITGDDVVAIFKGLQLDIGFPHQFLDVRYELADERHGTFRLASCGALMDIEPMGEKLVRTMCHTIEDPTFPATGRVTNPRAQVLPIHRPPRVPVDRKPHCAWAVTIDAEADSVPHPNEAVVADSLAARIVLPTPVAGAWAEPGGLDDYSGAFDPGFELEDLSHEGLQTALAEIAMAGHLLVHGYLLSLEQRFGRDVALEAGAKVLAGLGALTSERLTRALGAGGGAAGITQVLRCHPVFAPAGYVETSVDPVDERRLRFAVRDCAAADEPAARTWVAALADAPGGTAAFAGIVWGAEPRARVEAAAVRPGERLAFDITVDPDAPAAAPPEELALARLSTGANFVFRHRRPVRGVAAPVKSS